MIQTVESEDESDNNQKFIDDIYEDGNDPMILVLVEMMKVIMEVEHVER